MAYTTLGDQAALEAAKNELDKKKAIAAAKEKARVSVQIIALRNKGAANAKAGKYLPPPSVPAPDFDTMNYQAGWLSTGVALPAGVVHIGEGGRPVQGEETAAGASKTPLIVGGLAAAAAVAFFVLRR
jgi:hypothetical protein